VRTLSHYLLRYLAHEKMASLQAAVTQKAADLLAEAEADLSFRVRTLEMPIEEPLPLLQGPACREKPL